jgi:hypothetical protein
MPGLVPGIHAVETSKTWMAGTSPAMTEKKQRDNRRGTAWREVQERRRWRIIRDWGAALPR